MTRRAARRAPSRSPTPPFIGGASGLPIEIEGEHVARGRLQGHVPSERRGPADLRGPARPRSPSLPALRHVVVCDEFEGQIGWYIGYDGPGCVTLTREGDSIVLAIDIGPGS